MVWKSMCGSSRLCARGCDGVRKSDADKEREARLDGVVKAHAGPWDMGLVESQDAPEQAAGICARHGGKSHDLAHHEQHHETAISIDGDVARGQR